MTTRRWALFVGAIVLSLAGSAATVSAHGLIGARFLPATLATDDPFVADELSFPTIFHITNPRSGDTPATKQTDFSAEFSKRLTPDLGLSLAGTWRVLAPEDGATVTGFDNMEVSLKYQIFKSPVHETLVSLGVSWDVGGTGSQKVGAEHFDTVKPTLFFGKGFGDLPDRLDLLKPMALTGVFGYAIPTRGHTKTFVTDPDTGDVDVQRELNPRVVRWGFSLQYSLQYLQSNVRDVGIRAPFSRLIPLVEVALETPTNGADGGRTTGTVNPGIIWWGRYVQLGLEAVVPINRASGNRVGVLAQLHFYLDDILPQVFSWTPFHGVLGPTQPR
jgi:hypothetical protein